MGKTELKVSRWLSSVMCAAWVWSICSSPVGAAEKEASDRSPAAIELGAPFAENAILQRQMAVPVWGWSKPGAKITVKFAGQTKTAAAGKDGKWMLQLDPLQANADPAEMVMSDNAGRRVILKNILVGEVWLASGQSNMQWPANKCSVGRVLMKQIAERVKGGKEKPPIIREAKVANLYSVLHPIEHAEGRWSCDAGNFSAIAYAFAYELHKELGVPIGILNCSFSSTTIEAWTPRLGFAGGTDEYTRSVYRKILETDPTTPEHKAAWIKYYREIEGTLKENAKRVKNGQAAKAVSLRTPGNMAGNRDASWLFNARLNPMIPYAIRGGIWNQGYANMGGGITYYHNLHAMIRGWRKVWNRPDLPVYFHQFYCPKGYNDGLSLNSAAEMRLGTWLARDIPNANMASQIDITGGVHYYSKTVPGQRLARHALSNQYGKDIVADGPMFKSYKVEGAKLIVEFDHADGGLVVAETGTQASPRTGPGIAKPTVIANGDDKVTLFYLADKNRVWHRARMKIDGEKVILTAPGVSAPRGVAYGCNGVGWLPNLYNRALLPMSPFIYYDHKLVTSRTWPDKPIKVAGVKPDPSTVGKRYEYRKMPLLSTQFRENAVIQAGVPVTFWGSAVHNWGYEAEGQAVIKFSFAGIKKTIPVTPGMREWRCRVPAMKASARPETLKVVFEIDGQAAHERVCRNIVVGDVWYVASPGDLGVKGQTNGMVRIMARKAKRSSFPRPSRYSVAVSTTPPEKNRFASKWENAGSGVARAVGERIHARTGKPVGVVYMHGHDPQLKGWIAFDCLEHVPSLKEDYRALASVWPGNPYYDANVRRYITDWKKYWSEFIPQIMATKKLPDDAPAWGTYPSLSSSNTTTASQTYNVLVHSFTPGSFKGIIFLCSETMFEKDQGANYGPELSALANCWKDKFDGADPHFFYTIPSKALALKVTRPGKIKGKSTAYEIGRWWMAKRGDKEGAAAVRKQLMAFMDRVVNEAYR